MTLNGTGVSGEGGALRNTAGSNTVSGNLTLGSNTRIAATGGSLTVSGNVGGGNNVLYVGAQENVAVSGVISGAGNTQNETTTSLFKDGAKTLTLSGNNTYTGDTRVTEGRLVVAAGGNLGSGSDVFVSDGAVLAVDTDTAVASIQETANNNGGEVAIGSGATLTINGANKGTLYQDTISGQGNLVVDGSGTTSLSLYGTQSWTGTTTVSGGKLSTAVALASSGVTVDGGTFETTADNVLGDTVGVTIDGGTFSVGGSDTIGVLSGAGGTLALGSGKTLTSSFNSASNAFLATISGDGAFAKAGSGTLMLAGNNTYTGGTTLSGGELIAGDLNAFGTGFINVGSGTTLNLGSFNIINTITNNGGTVSSSGIVSNVDAEAGETTIAGANSTVSQVAGTATVNVDAADVTVNSITGGTVNSGASGSGMQVASVSSSATLNV
ncbi:MAG: autotransporter-associated beta strand repeat-containing protein, partial [Ilumatobacteraceae bacterium]